MLLDVKSYSILGELQCISSHFSGGQGAAESLASHRKSMCSLTGPRSLEGSQMVWRVGNGAVVMISRISPWIGTHNAPPQVLGHGR